MERNIPTSFFLRTFMSKIWLDDVKCVNLLKNILTYIIFIVAEKQFSYSKKKLFHQNEVLINIMILMYVVAYMYQ